LLGRAAVGGFIVFEVRRVVQQGDVPAGGLGFEDGEGGVLPAEAVEGEARGEGGAAGDDGAAEEAVRDDGDGARGATRAWKASQLSPPGGS
jgi:hypothetical protein